MIKKYLTDQTNIINIPTDYNYASLKEKRKQIISETGIKKQLVATSRVDDWYKINGEWYYFKQETAQRLNHLRYGYPNCFINELLGVEISRYFNLDTVDYQFARLASNNNDRLGIISKNFMQPGIVYKTCIDYGLHSEKYFKSLTKIKKFCKTEEDYKKLLIDIKRFAIRDFFTSQTDRHSFNFQFQEQDNHTRLAPLYDYEESFPMHKPDYGYYNNAILTFDINDPKTQSIIQNDETFQELLHQLMDIDIGSILSTVEEQHHICIPTSEKAIYKNHSKKIKQLVKTRPLIKG